MNLRFAFCDLVLIFSLISRVTALAAQPNIVLIMADDMGYSDIGPYGGEINTPNLERLASAGLRFTQFYNTGRCCPTRASLLSGLYPHQAGVGWMMTDRGYDGYLGDLNRQCVTIAEALKPAGYSTYMTGKWHVTKHVQPEGPKDNWPLQRGFDRFYGTITGAGSFYDPGTLTRDNTMISPFADPEYQPKQYYYTEAISDHAVRYINEHSERGSKNPFFMYVAYTCAHWPMHAIEKDIAKYKGKYDGGYEPIRKARAKRVEELGLVKPEWNLTPQVGDWEAFEEKAWESRCMEVYAAMIDNMDRGIGQIVAALKKNGQFENTLIMFLQDNGGCQEGNGRRGDWKRPAEVTLPKIAADAIRLDVVPKQNRAGIPTLTGPGIMPGPEDTYIAYGINWANVSNTPFREYKHFVHEGGISTPLIAHWPSRIKRKGELDHQPGHLIDLMATCVDVSRAKYPTEVKDQKIKPMEGVSLARAFDGKSLDRKNPLFWEHEGNRAVRDGKWKLVAKENRPWELYDMELDRTETNDLSLEKPELINELAAKWDAYAKRANVLPLGAWRGKPNKTSFNKKQKLFGLKQGEKLPQERAPFVEGKAFTITAELAGDLGEGVIVAQGGTADGYALYVKGGRLAFATRHQGKLVAVSGSDPLPSIVQTVSAALKKDGVMTLAVDGVEIAINKTVGPMLRMPIDGLQVGSDESGAVGEYKAPFQYAGKIEKLTLKIEK